MIRIFKFLDKLIFGVTKWIAIFCTLLLFILLILNVSARFLHINSFPWLDEIVKWSFSWLVFFGAAALWREGEHFQIEWVPDKIKKLKYGMLYPVILDIIALMFFIALTYYGIVYTVRSAQWTSILHISVRFLYVCVPISATIMTVYTLRNIFNHIRDATKGTK